MPSYSFKARNGEGQLVTGVLDTGSEALVMRDLHSRGLYPVEVKESRRSLALFSRLADRKKIKHEERIMFLRQFEAMIRSGIPITSSLVALEEQSTNPTLTKILLEIRRDIEGGSTLAGAVRKHPALLSGIHASLVEAGEEGGVLDEILVRLCEMFEYDEETKARVRSATLYPGIVITELVLGFVVIIRFVFPRFKALFSSRGADLPLPTRIMIAVSDFTSDYWWHIIVGAAIVAIAGWRYAKTKSGKMRIDELVLKVPLFGDIILMILMSRFSRVLASLIDSGIPFVRSLTIVERTIDNKPIQQEITEMGKGIQKGRGIAESIRKAKCFPAPVIKMLEVGEKSGKISEMLMLVSRFYDRQVDYKIKNLTTALEPILLVILGVSVLFMALSVFLPMWDMSRVVMGG